MISMPPANCLEEAAVGRMLAIPACRWSCSIACFSKCDPWSWSSTRMSIAAEPVHESKSVSGVRAALRIADVRACMTDGFWRGCADHGSPYVMQHGSEQRLLDRLLGLPVCRYEQDMSTSSVAPSRRTSSRARHAVLAWRRAATQRAARWTSTWFGFESGGCRRCGLAPRHERTGFCELVRGLALERRLAHAGCILRDPRSWRVRSREIRGCGSARRGVLQNHFQS